MDEDKFNEIEKILAEESPVASGPMRVRSIGGLNFVDLSMAEELHRGQDMIVYVKYLPEENRYKFATYEKGGKK
jgi:hypothetical protein